MKMSSKDWRKSMSKRYSVAKGNDSLGCCNMVIWDFLVVMIQ
ncbi:hypothetical protein SAMN05421659_10390 [[Clostridium] fimetarium]|uniref:Uncharacterized protein n=1 Tax=[Clostridium] fimetarium TaxID=99656 RepID=A0A1I0NGQ2_9FIRM|nr:hypothetical protein SAMN05421659_10390 [[Clostridium] fimetarium]